MRLRVWPIFLLVNAVTACTTTPIKNSFSGEDLRAPSSYAYPADFDFLKDIESAQSQSAVGKNLLPEVANAKARLDKLFEYARKSPKNFFEFMRKNKPIYKSESAKSSSRILGDKEIPDIILVTKHKDVLEILDNNKVFTVKPYQTAGMDASVGHPFMLARENTQYNAEKTPMHAIIDGRGNAAKVREIVAQLSRRAIQEGAKNGQIDIVKTVTRAVPIGLNEEYFGFNGPDRESLFRWSRATQHAFFHNSERSEEVKNHAIQAGIEMRAHITKTLLPNRKEELKNGRPSNDVVSLLIGLGDSHKLFIKEDRMVANTIGMLVGSVETTSTAITQALNVILSNRFAGVKELAIKAANENNDELLSRIVWEALRFDPINPWVARLAEKDFVLAKGTERETEVKAGTIVFAASESAMQDEEVFTEPMRFSLKRDPNSYMHIGYGYHRCLGDDVAFVMVPEVIKHLLKLKNLRIKNRLGETEPFPETFVLAYDEALDAVISEEPDQKSIEYKSALYKSLVEEFLMVRAEQSNEVRAVQNDLANILIRKLAPAAELASKNNLEKSMVNYASQVNFGSDSQREQACVSTIRNKKMFSDESGLRAYCQASFAFRACYVASHHVLGQSSFMSYYRCAYGQNLLSQKEREDFKTKLASTDQFYFLKLEGAQ
jgi:cytochrome P450